MAFTGLGAGTVGDPYQITTWNQFKEISTNLSANFKVMNAIDAASNRMANSLTFTGVLDCQNFRLSNIVHLFAVTGTVKNAKIDWNASVSYMLFDAINTGAILENIEIENKNSIAGVPFLAINAATFTNLTIFSPIILEISYYAYAFSGATFNNCTFQSSVKIKYGGTMTSCIFNNTKFIVTNTDQNNIDARMNACTFNNCLIFGDWYSQGYSSTVGNRNTFNNTSIISNYTITRTGALTNWYGILKAPGIHAQFTKCYFGGNININHSSYTETSGFNYRLFAGAIYYGAMTDCHFGFQANLTFNTPSIHYKTLFVPDTYASGTKTRVFVNSTITGQAAARMAEATPVTNGFLDITLHGPGLPNNANYTQLTTTQTKAAANFTNFDFVNVWQITEGAVAPTLRNVIYSESDYMLGPVLNSISVARDSAHVEKLSINTAHSLPSGSSLLVYCSTDLATLVNPANLVNTTVVSSLLITADLPVNEGIFYTKVVFTKDAYTQEFSASDFHYEAAQPATTIINIVAPNYMTPTGLLYLHGIQYLNGFVYGSARGSWNGTDNGESLIKLKDDDYSIFTIKKLYANKTNSLNAYGLIDQIVFCSGFLWCLSSGYLIRINPDDLNYMVFTRIAETSHNQPIGSDGTFLFITTETAVYKVNTALLLDNFIAYSYTGAAPVSIPPAAILGSCNIIQLHTTIAAYLHSIIADSLFIYLAITTNNTPNGYDSGINMYHVQKIDKSTMLSVGDVVIPKCTDDMVQSVDFLFLAPEMVNITPDIFGSSYGLVAIKKSNLELKYLKALHKEFNTINEVDRQCFGVFYFNNRIIVQLVNSKKSVIINTLDVESWGDSFPIGGATEGVYSFQKNGVAVSYPPNELVLDNKNWVHISTWGLPGDIMKFPLSSMPGILKNPVIQTALINTNITGATVGGYIIDEGASPITAGGFKYGTDPLNLTQTVAVTPFSYDFQKLINSLPVGIYYVQAYGTNTEGTFLGNTIMFSVVAQYNAVSLRNDDTIALLEFIDTHFGCSIRCVQDAPGIATGVTGTVTDQDGNTYDTVVINEKRWMVQNLKTKKYQNGDAIPEVSASGAWQGLSSGGYCNVI